MVYQALKSKPKELILLSMIIYLKKSYMGKDFSNID